VATGSKYLVMKEIQEIAYCYSFMGDIALSVIIIVDYWNKSPCAEEQAIPDKIIKLLKWTPLGSPSL